MICKYCGIETTLDKGAHSNHVRWCHDNPSREANRTRATEILVIARRAKKMHDRHLGNQYTKAARVGRILLVSQATRDKISVASTGRKHTAEMKKLLSAKRKAWLAANPDKHVWKRDTKFASVPCHVLKDKLTTLGLSFVEEYTPLTEKAYSVDIAFPTNKVAVEVNGEQHYNRDRSLKPYYQERHDLLERYGWRVLEMHYAFTYKDEAIDLILEALK